MGARCADISSRKMREEADVALTDTAEIAPSGTKLVGPFATMRAASSLMAC